MQLKNLADEVALLLPDNLLWSDEHAWSPAVVATSYLIIGALLTMKPMHPLDPVCMSPEARLVEVAAILALDIVRLRTPPSLHQERESQKDLGLCQPQRVHSNPDTPKSATRFARRCWPNRKAFE